MTQARISTAIALSTLTLLATIIPAADATGSTPPVAYAGPDQSIENGSVLWLDGSASYDPDGSIVAWEWDFGDGATAFEATTTHEFAQGVWDVTLTVTDDQGDSASDTMRVHSCMLVQAAIDATPAGGTLVLQPCRYGQTAHVYAPIAIEGAGGATFDASFPGATDGPAITIHADDVLVRGVDFANRTNAIRIDGDHSNVTIVDSDLENVGGWCCSDRGAVWLTGVVQDLEFEDVHAASTRPLLAGGAIVGSAIRNVTLTGTNCDQGPAVNVQAFDSVLRDSALEGACIYLNGDGNTVAGNTLSGYYPGLSLWGTGNVVEENTIGTSGCCTHLQLSGSWIFRGNAVTGMYNTNFAGNGEILDNTFSSNCCYWYNTVVSGPSSGRTLVSGNTFNNAPVRIDGSNVHLLFNTFQGASSNPALAIHARESIVAMNDFASNSAPDAVDHSIGSRFDGGDGLWAAAGFGNFWDEGSHEDLDADLIADAIQPVDGSASRADRRPLVASRQWETTSPMPPIAVAGSDRAATAGETLGFDGSLSFDPLGGSVVSYSWDFGDGTSDVGASVAHAYAEPGEYVARLTVIDDEGQTASDAVVARVCADVQALVDAAAPGSVVTLPPCMYSVPIGINQPLTLEGADRDGVRFDATFAAASGGPAIDVAADNVTLRNMTFVGWQTAIRYAGGSDDGLVRDVTFTNVGGSCCGTSGAVHMPSPLARLTVASVQASGTRPLVSTSSSVEGVRIVDSVSTGSSCDSGHSISLTGPDNVVSGNVLDGCVSLNGAGNAFEGNTLGGSAGLYVYGPSAAVRDNAIGSGNCCTRVYLQGAESGAWAFERNVVRGLYDVYFFGPGNLDGNEFRDSCCYWYNANVYGSSAGPTSVTDNLFQNAPLRIVGEGLTLLRNTFANATTNTALLVDGASGATISRNRFENNNEDARDHGSATQWSSGGRGNAWDAYTGADADGDGIGDTPFHGIGGNGNVDPHPLVGPQPCEIDCDPCPGALDCVFNVTLTMSLPDRASSATFGVHLAATSGFDAGLDEPAPPSPPDERWTRLYLLDPEASGASSELARSLLAPSTDLAWDLHGTADADVGEPITLSWSSEEVAAIDARYEVRLENGPFFVDMRATSSLTAPYVEGFHETALVHVFQAPDLVTIDFALDETVRVGEELHVAARVRNVGFATAHDANASIVVDGNLVGTVELGDLAPGDEADVAWDFVATVAGEHTVSVVAATGSTERTLANNTATGSVFVTRYLVELLLDGADALDVRPGQTVSYPMTITNLGNDEDTFDLFVTGLPAAWSTEVVGPPGALAPGESAPVTLHVSAPADFADVATIADVSLEARSSTDPGAFEIVQTHTRLVLDFTLHLRDGWNMVSIPVTPDDPDADAVLGGAVEALYSWTGTSYQIATTMEPGRGYWALSLSEQTIDVAGVPLSNVTLALVEGWNLVGGPAVEDDLGEAPPSVSRSLWHWDGVRYDERETLVPGEGYWLHVHGGVAGVALDGGASSPAAKPQGNLLGIEARAGAMRGAIELGARPGATAGFDAAHDALAPPTTFAEEHVELTIAGTDGLRYARSVTDERAWTVRVRTAGAGGAVVLAWDPKDAAALAPGERLVLVDGATHVDMGLVPAYVFDAPAGEHVRSLEVRRVAIASPVCLVTLDGACAVASPVDPFAFARRYLLG